MKLLRLFLALIVFVFFDTALAQVKTKTSLPDWGVAGQDNATYYYIPAAETYYDLEGRKFTYLENGKWIRSNLMPSAYKDIDLYNTYKVVLIQDHEPFSDFYILRNKYPKIYRGELQATVRPKKEITGL